MICAIYTHASWKQKVLSMIFHLCIWCLITCTCLLMLFTVKFQPVWWSASSKSLLCIAQNCFESRKAIHDFILCKCRPCDKPEVATVKSWFLLVIWYVFAVDQRCFESVGCVSVLRFLCHVTIMKSSNASL